MSMVSFSNPGEKLTIADVSNFESELGFALPKDFKSFYLRTNGGSPDLDCWPIQDDYEPIMIFSFLSMKYDRGDKGTLEGTYFKGVRKGYLPQNLVPFATDCGNNYICVDSEGKVYFYATDAWMDGVSMEENMKRNKRFLCESFSEFIDSLVEEDEAYE